MGAFSSLLRTFVSGFVFGGALLFSSFGLGFENSSHDSTLSHVFYGDGYVDRYLYLIVLFFTASACSVGVIYVANQVGWAKVNPRGQASYGWFDYDGNLIGGVLQGVAMAMTRTEPGLVFVRAGMGRVDAWWLVVGGALGGLGFVLVSEKLKRKGDTGGVGKGSLTLQDSLGISMRSMMVCYEIIVVCAMVLMCLYVKEVGGDHESKWSIAVIGGTLFGLAQLMSLLLTGGTIGVSSAYPAFAVHILCMLGGTRPHPGYGSIAFACGLLMSGTCASAIYASTSDHVHSISTKEVAVLGGFLMIFGSRMAGGCSSGHGISGCGTLSISSFATLTAMAVGAGIWKIAID